MARVKPKRQGIHIDMTAMSDMAWLLLTFFILTTQFKPQEVVTINPPSSISQIKIKDNNMMRISVANDGKYYFSLDEKFRVSALDAMGEKYGIKFTDKEKSEFKRISDFGVPIKQLKQYLNLTEGNREDVNVPGISGDSLTPEIADWVFLSWKAANDAGDSLDLGIRGDMKTQYPKFKNLLNRLQEKNMNKFQLITAVESKSE